MKKILMLLFISFIFNLSYSQNIEFEKLNFLIGEWDGVGEGFGNDQSTIESSFQLAMDSVYIEVFNESFFTPTDNDPQGEHHIDHGFISFDSERDAIIFRQFHNEGYIIQYVLNDVLSNDSTIVFESENIENLSTGRARWIINKLSDSEIKMTFDVSFTEEGAYTCFGENNLIKEE